MVAYEYSCFITRCTRRVANGYAGSDPARMGGDDLVGMISSMSTLGVRLRCCSGAFQSTPGIQAPSMVVWPNDAGGNSNHAQHGLCSQIFHVLLFVSGHPIPWRETLGYAHNLKNRQVHPGQERLPLDDCPAPSSRCLASTHSHD